MPSIGREPHDVVVRNIHEPSRDRRGGIWPGQAGTGRTTDLESEPSTFFGPDGKIVAGRSSIIASYRAGASRFGPDGENRLEILQSAEGGDIAHWCGIQRAIVDMDGKAVAMNLRVTELFRREDGEWRLVHRHADFLKD